MDSKRNLIRVSAVFSVVILSLGSFLSARAIGTGLTLSADTAVYLSSPGITLTLASGGTSADYSVSTSTLAVDLASGNSLTVKSNNLYTLTNSQGLPTLCSASPAFSYVTFTATSTVAVTVTPTTTIACTNTAPVISSFTASPSAITSGQSSALSWSISGADTVSINNGIGAQSNATSSSVSVSPTQTTTYTISAVNYLGTTTAQTTVTVTPASGGGGGGSVSLPTISSFSAQPVTIAPGQSSSLAWVVAGASGVNITPSVGTSTLNPFSGSATVTPATTTTYTLSATNAYGQSVTAIATVTVSAGSDVSLPTPASPPTGQPTTSSAPAYCLVNHSGTYYLILSGIRHGIANPGLLYSYGYGFGNGVVDTAAYESLATGDLLGPGSGALVKTSSNTTVYLVSQGAKHGFTSARVFAGLGYKFSQVLTIPAAQLDALPESTIISSRTSRHLSGAIISSKGTIYSLGPDSRYPYPSLSVYNSWNLKNDFSRVLPANAADLTLPIGSPVTPRTSCNG
jgi:hypothetical protein